MINLAVTRNKNQLESLLLKAKKKNINIIPLPVTEIISMLSDGNQIPDLTHFDWLFFSSANGVHTFLAQCKKEHLPHAIKIAVVGEKTAEAVRSYNLDIHFQPTQAYGKYLFEEFSNKYNNQSLQILYIRAERINFNAQEFLAQTQIKYNELISYKSQEKVVNLSEVDQLTDNDYILFTAPSTVTSYKNQFGTPKAKLIAIGNTTKDAIEKNDWITNIILDKPEIDKVLEYI